MYILTQLFLTLFYILRCNSNNFTFYVDAAILIVFSMYTYLLDIQ